MQRNKISFSDVALAGTMLLLAALLFIGGWSLPASRFEPMGPSGMPLTVATALAVLSVILLISAIFRHEPDEAAEPSDEVGIDPMHRLRVGLRIAVFFAYLIALATHLLSFMVATVAFLVIYGLIEGDFSRRALLTLVTLAFAIGVGVTLILEKLLAVTLPGA